jgi:phosphatidylinositol-3-phosphatase
VDCAECQAPLEPDQRYCLECGARTDPPPPRGWLPSARAAAVAVLLVIGFGVALGSAVAPPGEGAAAETVVLTLPAAATATPTATAAPSPEPTPAPEDTATPEPVATPEQTATPTPTRTPKATATPAETPAPTPVAPPAVEHVFLILLSGGSFDAGLRKQGELVSSYSPVTEGELANEVALLSGQDPTPAISAGCPQYDCLYPPEVKTLADQLTAAGKTWRAYVEDQPAPCSHPAPGAADAPQGTYVTRRNPFVYFHSLLDGDACTSFDVGFDQLAFDLTSADTTPSLSWIVPNRCHDGSGTACPAGSGDVTSFLATTVAQILRSKAYAEGGLVAITSAQGGGLLLLSQQVKPGSSADVGSYNHYSLLRSIEDLFGLDHLGHAGDPGVLAFDKAVYNAGGEY